MLLLLAGTIIYIFSSFNNKKQKLIRDKQKLQREFDEELIKSKIEMQEATIKHISWELHDNIGQILSVARLNLYRYQDEQDQPSESITETNDLIMNAINDVRNLSHSLSWEYSLKEGLLKALEIEFSRIEKLNIKTSIRTLGDPFIIAEDKEVLLFRILQEFINNSLKHSKCTMITCEIKFSLSNMYVTITDNGKGIAEEDSKGFGMQTMNHRMALLKGELSITNATPNGTQLILKFNNGTEH